MKFKKSENDKMNDLNILKQISQNIREKVIVKGILGITNVSMYKYKHNYELIGNDYVNKELVA